jgi:hypothetical protein
VKNCKPSVLFSNEMLFYMKRSAIFFVQIHSVKKVGSKISDNKTQQSNKYCEFSFKLIDCVV